MTEQRTPEDMAAEIKRLSDALHSRRAHPDYEYKTTTCGRKAYYGEPEMEAEGWESNGEGHDSWERFDYHEEHYWRRRKVQS